MINCTLTFGNILLIVLLVVSVNGSVGMVRAVYHIKSDYKQKRETLAEVKGDKLVSIDPIQASYQLNIVNFWIWFEAMKRINPKFSLTKVAATAGFSTGYLCQKLNPKKYNVSPFVGAFFMGSICEAHGLEEKALFLRVRIPLLPGQDSVARYEEFMGEKELANLKFRSGRHKEKTWLVSPKKT